MNRLLIENDERTARGGGNAMIFALFNFVMRLLAIAGAFLFYSPASGAPSLRGSGADMRDDRSVTNPIAQHESVGSARCAPDDDGPSRECLADGAARHESARRS